jgi:hypothetical protein
MRLISIDDRIRNDWWCSIECEYCANKEMNISMYDDTNYWMNVLPNRKCKKCGKTRKEIEQAYIDTMYADEHLPNNTSNI